MYGDYYEDWWDDDLARKENEDFAQDGDFENRSAEDIF